MITNALLDEMSRIGDDGADQVVRDHAASNERLVGGDLVQHLAANLQMLPGRRSPAVDKYLGDAPDLPRWVDPEKMRRSAAFFTEHPGEISSALFCASLPESYASPRGSRVLTLTGLMVDGLVRRVIETAQMILDSMTLDGLNPGGTAGDDLRGKGYDDIRRVRLMHAAVRHFIQNDPSVPHTAGLPAPDRGWSDAWGIPLNQEDLLGGLLTFSVTVFEVLDKLGVEYDPGDFDAYLHRWCVIGALIGVDERLLPLTPDQARAAAELIRSRWNRPSDDGRLLTGALADTLQASLPLMARAMAAPLPGHVRGLVRAVIHWFVGAELAAMLGIDNSMWSPELEAWLRSADHAASAEERRDPAVALLMSHFGHAAMHEFMQRNRFGDRPAFAMPEQLRPPASGPLVFRFS